jgi:uncharacterized peroxidase-related enzyme
MIADLIEDILGGAPDSALATLRQRRPEARRHAEGAHRALLLPEEPGGLTPAERAAVALRVALRDGPAPALADRFRALLAAHPAAREAAEAPGMSPGGPPRLAALLRYADRVGGDPGACGQADIDALRALGLAPGDVVALTQVIAFVPYQVRLIAGLQAMAGRSPTGPGPAPALAAKRFTLAEVGWQPRLPPVEDAAATPAQRAALAACPPGQRDSLYFRTLALDPESLKERGALFTTVMYAPRGLPRADRELATAVVSMVNGCVYCTAVHARRFVELTKRPALMQALFDAGLAAPAAARERAIIDVAARLTAAPAAFGPADLAPLGAAGLDALETLDLIHAVAMFANANRLMQALGDTAA